MALIFLKFVLHVTKVCLEGSMSQHFDIGLSVCLMLCKRSNFEKINGNKYQKFPFFVMKSKPVP